MRFINLAHIKATGLIQDLKKDVKGATMIEYSILIGIITAVTIASIVTMGTRVTAWWGSLVAATV